jgi:hypothetical protein
VPNYIEISIANELFKQIKQYINILETVIDDNESENLEIDNEIRVEVMTTFDFNSVDKSCFKKELQFDYMKKVYNFVKC